MIGVKRWVSASALAAGLLTGAVNAQDAATTKQPVTAAQDIPIATRGFADMSCGAWAASSNDAATRSLYVTWILGFLSGVNFEDPHHQVGVGEMLSSDTLILYVNKYCRDHPLSTIDGAAFSLVRELRAS